MNWPASPYPFNSAPAYSLTGKQDEAWMVGMLQNNGTANLRMCKEYILDEVYSSCIGGSGSIYVTAAGSIDTDKTLLATSGWRNDTKEALRLVHEVEDRLKLPHTKTYLLKAATKYAEEVLLFQGDADWLLAPPLLSLYALLLRTGRKYKGDPSILGQMVCAGLDHIVEKGHKKVFYKDMKGNWTRGKTRCHFYGIHYCGIICFGETLTNNKSGSHSQLNTRDHFPHWFE